MTHLAVTGYASLDYAVRLAGPVMPDTTTRIAHRDAANWPRIGGAPTYVAGAAKHTGLPAAPVTWVGDDGAADDFIAGCARAGLETDAVQRIAGQGSPVCFMLHQPDGTTACLYDPGAGAVAILSTAQAQVIADAQTVCVTVGPASILNAVLAAVLPDTPIDWVVKTDPVAFPERACRVLGARARVVFCNQAERTWIAPYLTDTTIVVETRGANGILVSQAGRTEKVPVTAIDAPDPTGAGDTFAGGFIAALEAGAAPVEAARAGRDAATRLLATRITSQTQEITP